MPTAYSYLRFSTPEQSKGDSLRRQTEAAARYAKKHGLALDTELSLRDLGVSAYRGKNAVEGALGKFTEAVDSGRVSQGSYLLVENLDRLSRDRIMPALNRFSSLLEKGITVVTLSDQKVYTAESLNNLPDLMLSLLVLSRAHEESARKAETVSAAWARKRERAVSEGHKLTGRIPAWLRMKDGQFSIIPERAAIVRRIFEMAAEGLGPSAIARKLNAEGVKPFTSAKDWHSKTLWALLHNPAVIGKMQPKRRVASGRPQLEPAGPALENYFPAIVSEATFYRIPHNPMSGKKHHPFKNILSGIVHCARCGSRLHYKERKGIAYLGCDGARKGQPCKAPGIRYLDAVSVVTHFLRDSDFDARSWLASAPENNQGELRKQRDSLAGKLRATEAQRDVAIDTLLRVPSPALEARLGQLEKLIVSQTAILATLDKRLRAATSDTDELAELEAVIALAENIAAGGEAAKGEARIRMNAALRRVVERVALERRGSPEELFLSLTFRNVAQPLERSARLPERKRRRLATS